MRRYLLFGFGLLVILVLTFAITWKSLDQASSGFAAFPVAAAVLAALGAFLIVAPRFRTTIRVEARERVAGAPAEVFALAADPRNMPRYSPQILEVQMDGPLDVGATFRVSVRRGRSAREVTFEVTAYDPPRAIMAQPWFRGRPSRFRRTGLVVEEDGGSSTLVSWSEVQHSRVVARWLRPALERAEREGSAAMKGWLEAQLGRAGQANDLSS